MNFASVSIIHNFTVSYLSSSNILLSSNDKWKYVQNLGGGGCDGWIFFLKISLFTNLLLVTT